MNIGPHTGHVMLGADMSAILERLHAVFDGMPIVLAPIPTVGRPNSPHLDKLADYVAALANGHTGGILVLGFDAAPPHRVRGVADPKAWTSALRRTAAGLLPPVEVEIEVGDDHGRAIVAVQVPYAPVGQDLVRRADGAPVRLVDGRPVPQFRALDWAPAVRVPPMLASVEGSTPAWLDPEATHALATGSPATWSRDTRAGYARDGLLAADGVAVTRAGLLLAGLSEHRPDEDGVVLETPAGVVALQRGWLLLREDLRAEARDVGVRHADLVADLVMDVLVRTAGSAPTTPLIVDLTPELLTIEAPSSLRDDPHLAAMMKRWASWRPDRWKAVAVGWHLPVTWERSGGGLRVVAHLVRSEQPVARPAMHPVSRAASAAPKLAPVAAVPAPAPAVVELPTDAHQPRSAREAAVLALLADGNVWSRRDLDTRLGWSRSTLRTVLEHLVRAGMVTAEAPSPRSPFQAYRGT